MAGLLLHQIPDSCNAVYGSDLLAFLISAAIVTDGDFINSTLQLRDFRGDLISNPKPLEVILMSRMMSPRKALYPVSTSVRLRFVSISEKT